MLEAIGWLVTTVTNLVQFTIFLYVVLGWLYMFDAIPRNNRLLWQIQETLRALCEPMLRPVRRLLPKLGGVDLAPLAILLGAEFIKRLFKGLLY